MLEHDLRITQAKVEMLETRLQSEKEEMKGLVEALTEQNLALKNEKQQVLQQCLDYQSRVEELESKLVKKPIKYQLRESFGVQQETAKSLLINYDEEGSIFAEQNADYAKQLLDLNSSFHSEGVFKQPNQQIINLDEFKST